MQKKILCLLLATLLALGALGAVAAIHPDDLPEGAGLVVTAGTLRVRQGPTTDSAIIGRVYEGDLLTVLGSAGNWFRVLTPLGTEGYVYKNYVDAALKEDEPPVTDDGTYDDILLPDGEVEFEATLVRADGWNDYTPFAVQDFVYAGHMEKDGFVGSRTAFRLLCPSPAPLLHFRRFGIIVFNTILYSFSFSIKKLFFLTSRICLW